MTDGHTQKKPYFGGLDTLRAYAFLIVFISHSYFSFFTITDWGTRWFAQGEVGVQMFFVLSAFLITYLSLAEYTKTKTFSLSYFFKKRILRIWPVYFLVLVTSYIWYLASGSQDALGCLTEFVYFFGNVCMIQGIPNIPGSATLAPMWSVSVEQQFYVVFPLALLFCIYLFKNIGKRVTMYALHTSLAITFFFTLYVRYAYAHDWNYISYSVVTSLPAFIVGLYLAYGVHKKSFIMEHIHTYQRRYGVSAVISFFSFLYIKYTGPIGVSLYILPIIYTTCIWIVLAIQHKEEGVGILQSYYTRAVHYLGKISYGLYAYHMFAMVSMQYIFERTQPMFSSIGALILTIIFAHISYKYFESWFLKFK